MKAKLLTKSQIEKLDQIIVNLEEIKKLEGRNTDSKAVDVLMDEYINFMDALCTQNVLLTGYRNHDYIAYYERYSKRLKNSIKI